MKFWDGILQMLAKVFRVVNSSFSMMLVILLGSPLSVYIFRDVLTSTDVSNQFLMTVIVVLLPFLLYKALLYLLLTLFDFILISNTDYDKEYDVDIEKVRARVTKVLVERKVNYQSLDTIALGLEKSALIWIRGVLHLRFPLIYVATERPFVVIKIFRAIGSSKVVNLIKQVEDKERVSIRIFTEERNDAKVLAKIIINSLEFLNKEEMMEEEMGR
ncbi:MAG TPA: hypothetical protein VJI13_03290 [Candidatus Norongarragalinales archaeon]|nr:hypothetical protein [Candidatus Norongarragalinales archaeon]